MPRFILYVAAVVGLTITSKGIVRLRLPTPVVGVRHMNLRAILIYLSIPAFLAVAAFAHSIRYEPLSLESFSSYVVGGYFFYAAPYLVWLGAVLSKKFSSASCHAGFIAATIALAAICAFWLAPPDPSGLPMQWLLYWPLALILQVIAVGLTTIFKRTEPQARS